jgi:hypothetical protein
MGRIYRRPDGKYFIYIPKEVSADTMFPLKIPANEKGCPVSVEFSTETGVVTIKKPLK